MIDLVIIPDSRYGVKEKVKAAKWSDVILRNELIAFRNVANEIFLIADRYGLVCPNMYWSNEEVVLIWSGDDSSNKLTIYINEKITYDFSGKHSLPMTIANAPSIIKYVSTILYPPELWNDKSSAVKRSR